MEYMALYQTYEKKRTTGEIFDNGAILILGRAGAVAAAPVLASTNLL